MSSRGCLKLGSKCTGWYWVDGDPGYWQHVEGKVIGTSGKVLVENAGAGHIYSKVQIKTDEGTKIGYILQASNKCFCDKGALSFLGATVGNLPKFRDGKIISGCAEKVLVT